MKIRFNRVFKKHYKALPAHIQLRVDNRLELFIQDPKHRLLNLHPLKGKFQGYYSINITGDMRAIYKIDAEDILFVLLGTHSQIYG